MNLLWKILTSLRLTVLLLAFGIILVWVGTVAQADEGLYQAQARYFKHWFVPTVSLFGHRLPIPLPGGRTRLEGSTWYELDLAPQAYWSIWSDLIVHRIHRRVLEHIRREATDP